MECPDNVDGFACVTIEELRQRTDEIPPEPRSAAWWSQAPGLFIHAETHNLLVHKFEYQRISHCLYEYIGDEHRDAQFYEAVLANLRNELGWRSAVDEDPEHSRRGFFFLWHPNGSKLKLLGFRDGSWYFEPPPGIAHQGAGKRLLPSLML